MVKGLVGGLVILVLVTLTVVGVLVVVNFCELVPMLLKGFVKGFVGLVVVGDGVVDNFTLTFSVAVVNVTNGTFEVLGILVDNGRFVSVVDGLVGFTLVVFRGGNLVPMVVVLCVVVTVGLRLVVVVVVTGEVEAGVVGRLCDVVVNF